MSCNPPLNCIHPISKAIPIFLFTFSFFLWYDHATHPLSQHPSIAHKQQGFLAFYMQQSFTLGFEIILFYTCYQKYTISYLVTSILTLGEKAIIIVLSPVNCGDGALQGSTQGGERWRSVWLSLLNNLGWRPDFKNYALKLLHHLGRLRLHNCWALYVYT